jgi:hypothetical protein
LLRAVIRFRNDYMARRAVPLSSALLVSVAVACGAPQRSTTFITSAKAQSTSDTVRRTLSAEGHTVTSEEQGVFQTGWADTNFYYGQVDEDPATIIRRFTIGVAPNTAGTDVTVRVDAKRCALGTFNPSAMDVTGSCEDLDAIPLRLQREMETLRKKVRDAVGDGRTTKSL